MTRRGLRPGALPGPLLGGALFFFVVTPFIVLLVSSTPSELVRGLRHPFAGEALWLSAWTTAVSLGVVVSCGTPLAWLFARSRALWVRVVETSVELPIVVPPAVVGLALLQAFGRRGAFGETLELFGVALPFTPLAVVVAQVVVAAPFYIQTAAAGFRRVDEGMLLVARTLGATPERAFFRVAVPVALPSLLGGAALAWARALGEFGATLLFAGSFPGRTQTLPLAIYSALESDVAVARAIALLLGAVAFATLLLLRAFPRVLARRRHQTREGLPR